jgi:hypothetical protein
LPSPVTRRGSTLLGRTAGSMSVTWRGSAVAKEAEGSAGFSRGSRLSASTLPVKTCCIPPVNHARWPTVRLAGDES